MNMISTKGGGFDLFERTPQAVKWYFFCDVDFEYCAVMACNMWLYL